MYFLLARAISPFIPTPIKQVVEFFLSLPTYTSPHYSLQPYYNTFLSRKFSLSYEDELFA